MASIKLNEEQLKSIISESVKKVLREFEEPIEMEEEVNENETEESWNQFKTGAKTFFSNNNGSKQSLKDRWNSAKKNYGTQGELDSIQNIIAQLSKLIDEKQIDPQITVAQLVGGKYNRGRFGKMTGMAANRQNQINNRM